VMPGSPITNCRKHRAPADGRFHRQLGTTKGRATLGSRPSPWWCLAPRSLPTAGTWPQSSAGFTSGWGRRRAGNVGEW